MLTKLKYITLRYTLQAALSCALCFCVLILAGCASSPDHTEGVDASGKPKVLATFTIIADMVREVAGDEVVVESITKPGAEIHDYEPTPEDIKKARGAQIIFQNGLDLERWFDRFVVDSEARKVNLSETIEPMELPDSGTAQVQYNPHAWMSPANASRYVERIAHELARLLPEHAESFERRAKAYQMRLEEIQIRLTQAVQALPEEQRTLVTSEGAFSYLCRDAGLKEVYIWPVNAEQEGSPRQIFEVIQAVKKLRPQRVFTESTVSPKAMEQVAEETRTAFDAEGAYLLYVDSLSEVDGPVPTFIALLEHDIDALVKGLHGGK